MINLALIGVGAWGNNFLSTAKLLDGCKIKYVCSKTKNSFKTISDDYIKTTNFKDLLQYQDIDGVIIATPASSHFEIAEEFLRKNYNLLIEKPLTINYQQAQKLKSLKDCGKSKVLLGHVYLFDPAYIKTKELSKKIGGIKYIYHEMLNNGPACQDVSVLWHLGPHSLSIFLDVIKKKPVQIKAWGFYDLVFINLIFADQTQAFTKLSWLSPVKKRELVIVGDKGSLVYSDLAAKKITYYHQDRVEDTKISYPGYEDSPPLKKELEEFIEVIKKNKAIKKSGLDLGIEVTKLLSFAEKSLKNNGEVINLNE